VDFSATRKTTKLAGTNDMATMMKMAITTSVPWSLEGDEEQILNQKELFKRAVFFCKGLALNSGTYF